MWYPKNRGEKPFAMPITMTGYTVMKVFGYKRSLKAKPQVMVVKDGLPVADFLTLPDCADTDGKFSKTTLREGTYLFEGEGPNGKQSLVVISRPKKAPLVMSSRRLAALVS